MRAAARSGGDGKREAHLGGRRHAGLMRTDLLCQDNIFKHGDPALDKTVVAYLGPKNYDDLQAADTAAGFPTGFNKVIDFGWFAFIGKPRT